jgi:hypothetical protein
MTSKKNLWGELPNVETIRTPYTILKEQASILSEITHGLLIGEVVVNSQNDKFFTITLRIKAPSLNNYTYSVVEVQQPIQLYPVAVINLLEGRMGKYSSEEEFENALGEILSSQEVKGVISGLLAQIHADIPKQPIDSQ